MGAWIVIPGRPAPGRPAGDVLDRDEPRQVRAAELAERHRVNRLDLARVGPAVGGSIPPHITTGAIQARPGRVVVEHPDDRLGRERQSQLLLELPSGCVDRGLARVDAPARQRPLAGVGPQTDGSPRDEHAGSVAVLVVTVDDDHRHAAWRRPSSSMPSRSRVARLRVRPSRRSSPCTRPRYVAAVVQDARMEMDVMVTSSRWSAVADLARSLASRGSPGCSSRRRHGRPG